MGKRLTSDNRNGLSLSKMITSHYRGNGWCRESFAIMKSRPLDLQRGLTQPLVDPLLLKRCSLEGLHLYEQT